MDTLSEFKTIPLAVDLDGTLIASDLLWEGLFLLLRQNPLMIFMVPIWFAKGGPATVKLEIADRVKLDAALLPYRDVVLKRIVQAKAEGRAVVLATGTPRKFAEAIATHLEVFDAVFSTETSNLTSRSKCRVLEAAFGHGGFDYIGNSRHDLCLFDAARRAIVVAPDRWVSNWRLTRDAELLPTSKATRHTLFRMLRVHQWLKNSLVAVPLVVGHQFMNAGMILQCLLAFVAFSAAASSVYILNDFFDLSFDRRHATKCKRPFASGELSMRFGFASILVLLSVSGIAALSLPIEFGAVLLGYLAVTTVYSLYIKRTLMLDVLALAGLYTMRVLGGAAATGIPVSFWLLAFSTFFFLSLALVKRFTELRRSDLSAGVRIAGRSYRSDDLEVVGQAGIASAFSSAMVLALYIDSQEVKALYPHPWMIWPVALIVLYLTMRIWILARRDQMHDDPVVFIIRDWRSQLMIALGAIMLVGAVRWP